MMIENECLANQFIHFSKQPISIRRIAGLDDIESLSKENDDLICVTADITLTGTIAIDSGGADLEIQGLDQHASLCRPVGLEAVDEFLKRHGCVRRPGFTRPGGCAAGVDGRSQEL